ncbi:hypothetical protein HDIA_2468 [Hartmannibacter diazotrophicus]|uniref:DUF2842 domain-containing protein n=1 Tax=Hartmannibacter diazotrophicus TaxID=1482074 RepID=A0A2C9D755_9HYPH|nr:DUF2842 domain-containing protein [Hartmannibacter diazotrophicus]SON56009.1 hypothetical protein HDIA_2468 [Hartmannibacter diazotrophicus]
MPARLRSFIGAILLTLLVLIYPLIVMGLAVRILPEASKLVELLFYVVAGLAWVIPAGGIIKWMVRAKR